MFESPALEHTQARCDSVRRQHVCAHSDVAAPCKLDSSRTRAHRPRRRGAHAHTRAWRALGARTNIRAIPVEDVEYRLDGPRQGSCKVARVEDQLVVELVIVPELHRRLDIASSQLIARLHQICAAAHGVRPTTPRALTAVTSTRCFAHTEETIDGTPPE